MTRRLAVPVTLLITFLSLFLSSFNLAFASEIVEVKYAAASKARGSGACPSKFPATGSYSQGFRHQLTSACYSCPRGYERSLNPNINAGDACVKHTPASSVFSKAKYHGKKKVSKPSPKYGGNVFFDPRKGGEWWECHRDYPRRTAHPVTHKAACATKSLWPDEKLARAKFRSKTTRSKPSGAFYDPRGGGEYWSCPQGYNRTIPWGVNTGKACEKVIKGSTRTATAIRRGVRGCPSGAFEHGTSGACYSCPTGYKRSLVIANDLTKEPKACVMVTIDPRGIENQEFVAFAKDELKKMETVIELIVGKVDAQLSRMSNSVRDLLEAKSDAERQRIAAQIAAPIIRQLNASSEAGKNKSSGGAGPFGSFDIKKPVFTNKAKEAAAAAAAAIAAAQQPSIAADSAPVADKDKPVNLRGDRIESSVPGVPLEQTLTVAMVVDASLGLGGTFTPFSNAFPIRGNHKFPTAAIYTAFAGSAGVSAGADGSVEIGIWMDPYNKLAGGSMGVVGGVAYKAGYAMTFWWSTEEEPKFLGFTMTPQVGISAELEFTAGGTWLH